jgi:hypothetical protein
MGGAGGQLVGGFGGFTVAGSGGRSMAGNGGRGGAAGDCNVGCQVDEADLCEGADVTWVCEGNHDDELFVESCKEFNSSGRLRYCCPGPFLSDCK